MRARFARRLLGGHALPAEFKNCAGRRSARAARRSARRATPRRGRAMREEVIVSRVREPGRRLLDDAAAVGEALRRRFADRAHLRLDRRVSRDRRTTRRAGPSRRARSRRGTTRVVATENGSPGSWPAITSSASAASATVRVVGPRCVIVVQPPGFCGTRPYVGLMPKTPQNDAGIRIEPPPSLLSAIGPVRPQPPRPHRRSSRRRCASCPRDCSSSRRACSP